MRRLAVLVTSLAVGLGFASAALATFTSAASSGPMNLTSATLAAPTGPAAVELACANSKPAVISVSWTASTSSFTTGYTISRAATAGGPYTAIGTVSAGTTSFTDPSVTLAYSTAYFYVVDATYQSWTARSGQASVTTLSKLCK
jgi:hypothetical protein